MGHLKPHFFNFSIVKAAISLKDKVPMSPQQRFPRFSTWIRELDPPDLPFSYFTQIGVLWAGKRVFSIYKNAMTGLNPLLFSIRLVCWSEIKTNCFKPIPNKTFFIPLYDLLKTSTLTLVIHYYETYIDTSALA